MKLYLSSFNIVMLRMLQEIDREKSVNVLRSFGVESNQEHTIMMDPYDNIGSEILDNGSFSLNFADSVDDEKVSLQGFTRYAQKFGKNFDFYFSFDSNFTIDGYEENKEYYLQQKKAGLNPVPVLHAYSREEIEFYINEKCEFIALGSIMEEGSKKMQRTQADVDKATIKLHEAGVKVHLFGASSYNAIAHLPLYSCDSSSWAQNNKFGFILFWNEKKKGENKTDKLFFKDSDADYTKDRQYYDEYIDLDILENYLKPKGITRQKLMSDNSKNRYRQLVNALYYLTIEEIINKKQERNGMLVT